MCSFDYAVIIPAWNEAEYIESSVGSAVSAMRSQAFNGQLIVVDNNSTDNTAELAELAGAVVVFEPVNQISRARNAGANGSSARWLVFVDADTVLTAELLERALDLLSSNKVVGGGAWIAPDRSIAWLAMLSLRGWNRVASLFKLAAGCFVFCRADAFEQVGGFSLKRYAGEELVLSRALRRWGRKKNMGFIIIKQPSIVTSVRKIDWFSGRQLLSQYVFALIPGAMRSKRAMSTWYDESTKRTKKK